MNLEKSLYQDNHAEKQNLHRLFILRNIAVLGWGIAIYAVVAFMGMPIPAISMSMVILSLAGFNIFTWLRLRSSSPVGHLEFLFQLMIDVLALSMLLYLSGGASNPFVLLFLLPIIIATAVLPASYIWLLTVFTGICYSLLMWKYVPLPHVHGEGHNFSQHVWGMWLSFVISSAVIAYFVFAMRRNLRSKNNALAKAREQHLRDEQLLTLGTLAASTAHELGTPLGTMLLLSDELKEMTNDQNNLELITSLKEQISRCKDALTTLSASAGSIHLVNGKMLSVNLFLENTLDEWQQSHHSVQLDTDWQGIAYTAEILADRTLIQALWNILDNAYDASPNDVEWQARWDNDFLNMQINDRGNGVSLEEKKVIGSQPFTNKDGGMGLGLFLAHAIIKRFSGEVRLVNREDGGLSTRIRLPLSKNT